MLLLPCSWLYVLPSPIHYVELRYNAHVLGWVTSSTQWTSSLSSRKSFILDPWSWCADLWTTMGSGHSMPSTHPSRTWLGRCWVRHPSTLSFSLLFSHSSGVNSTSADWVDMLVSASSLCTQGCDFTLGVANRNSHLWWATFTLPLESLISYEGTPFVTWRITSYSTLLHRSFTFLFP